MNKHRLTTTLGALTLALGLAMPASMAQEVPASRILTENFVYDANTNLYGQGGWLHYGTAQTNPIEVMQGSLTYDGYINEPVGNSVFLNNLTSSDKDYHPFSEMVSSGSVYVSYLINVEEAATGTPGYFFALTAQTKAGLSDTKTGTDVCKVFVYGNSDGTYELALQRSSAFNTNCMTSKHLQTGTTYLVVVKYEFIAGNTNDAVSLWVNPDTSAESTPDLFFNATSGTDISTTYGGAYAVILRQCATASNVASKIQLDALRAATAWKGLFDSQTQTTASITADPNSFSFDPFLAGYSTSVSSIITASGLTEDITVECSEGVSTNVSTISKDASGLASGGVLINITATPNPAASVDAWVGTVTLSSPGAEDAVITLTMPVLVPTTVAQAARIPILYDADGPWVNYYKYTGRATVTYIQPKDGYYLIYMQDMTGAMCINTGMCDFDPSTLNVGDVVTDFIFAISDDDPVGLQVLPIQMVETVPAWQITDTGQPKQPIDITPNDFSPADNQYKLVRLNNAHFNETGTFTAKSYNVTVDSSSAIVRPFENTSLIGTDIPTSADVIGIAMSKSAVSVWPRSADDVIAGAPYANITKTTLLDFSNDAAPVGQSTQIMKLTVDAGNIAADAPIYVTGTNAAMFSVAPEVIPAGTGVTEVIVSYNPTAPGKHQANIYFDFDGTSAELNQSIAIRNCLAYDPANLPTLSLDPNTLTLRANVGETVRGTVTLNVANAFNDINVTKGNADVAGIIINSTYFLPSIAQQTVTITFQPQTEGNVTQTFTFSTMKGQPVTLTVNGIVNGSAEPDPVEGGELNLDTSNPYSIYTQDFADVTSNTPLDIPGWSNVAVEGSRAWWGYVGEDFTAAKVTAYDSRIQPGQGTPCEMLLVSPALSYIDAPSKTLKFKLMGKGLHDDMTDILDVCLVELVNGELYISVMDGFGIPVTADMNDQWINYDNIDMSVVPDMPDVFFIGFRFTSTRGRDNASQYFITDFSWGNYPTGVNSILAPADGFYTIYTMQGILLMKTDNVADLDRLPAGLYIINGRKVHRR